MASKHENREIVSLHFGQAGIQIGNACWQLFTLEHEISQDGQLDAAKETRELEFVDTFFIHAGGGKYTARAIYVDLEPMIIDQIRRSAYRELFDPDCLICGNEGGADNFGRGYASLGSKEANLFLDVVRKKVEECDHFQGFLFFHSLGGGTGSGFGTRILQSLSKIYPKKSKVGFSVYPSHKISSSIVEPYNSLLYIHKSSEFVDVDFIMDNESIFNVCQSQLGVSHPGFSGLNRIIAQVVSSTTSSLRFEGSVNVTLDQFQTNLVPFPRIHFPIASYAPLLSTTSAKHRNLTVHAITKQCFNLQNQMVQCKSESGRTMASCLLYRGDVLPNDVNLAVNSVKEAGEANFVEWCPTGFKVGINYEPITVIPGGDLKAVERTVCCLSNKTDIRLAWTRLREKYAKMLNRKAFMHSFAYEGVSESEFEEAAEYSTSLENEYSELEK